MRDPATATQSICELLGVEWEPGMADPYTTSAMKSFQAARKFATTDPKLMLRKGIDARLADKWREIVPPQKLNRRTDLLAKLFNYELLPELPEEFVWLSRKPALAHPAVLVHDFTGWLWGFGELSQTLKMPCIGIQCSPQLIDGCQNITQLAWRYTRLLPPMAREPVRLIAYSLGCRIAYRMAAALEEMGERVELVLLDGLVGPAGGMAAARTEQIRRRLAAAVDMAAAADMATAVDAQTSSSPPPPSVVEAETPSQSAEDALEPIISMLVKAGTDATSTAAMLLELPDAEDAPASPVRAATLYISAESSANRTNGSFNVVESCLPQLRRETLPGGHFDFVKLSADAIATHVDSFFAENDRQESVAKTGRFKKV